MRPRSLPPLLLCALFGACDSSSTPSAPASTSDPGFRLYNVSIWNDGPYTNESTLDSNGNVVRRVGHMEDIDTLRAVLPPADLARVKRLLEASASRHPTDIPTPFSVQTSFDPSSGAVVLDSIPIDGGGRTTRTIRYQDGSTSSMSAHFAVKELPASWTAVDPVDSMLSALFPR